MFLVFVFFGGGIIKVTHIRREESVDPSGSGLEFFQLEWQLRITFPWDMSDMTASTLRITHLIFHENMPNERREELRRKLVGDLLIDT